MSEDRVEVPAEAPEAAVTTQPEEAGQQEAPEPTQGETPEEAQKPQSRHQARKEKMARLERERDDARDKVKSHQERLDRAKKAAEGAVAPRPDAFETHDEYLIALGSWNAAKHIDTRAAADAEHDAQAAQAEFDRVERQRAQAVAEHWAADVADAQMRYADFEKVAYTAPISDEVANMVASMDGGADVAYYLGLNPELADGISRLDPVRAAMELGRIQATVRAPRANTTTNAPDPTSSVRPKSGAAKAPEDMTASEYAEWRSAGGTF